MQVLRGVGYASGDYVHDDEVVRIEDTATGKTYEIYLRRPEPDHNGELCIFIPRNVCKGVVTEEKYVVVTLGQ